MPIAPLTYQDFSLEIRPGREGWLVHAKSPDGAEAEHPLELPLTDEQLKILVLTMNLATRGGRRGPGTPAMQAAEELGSALFKAMFAEEILALFYSSLKSMRPYDPTGLRIKLGLQSAPELTNWPWEYLFDGKLFLSQAVETPIVRCLHTTAGVEALKVESFPLGVLALISCPRDYPQLNTQREQDKMSKAFERLEEAGFLRVRWLTSGKMDDLREALLEEEFHIFHFIGHGGFDPARQEGLLVFTDDDGRSKPVHPKNLAMDLKNHMTFRLAVLNACEGARTSIEDPFASSAAKLIQFGIPAVVAMQFPISDEAAIVFAKWFYAALVRGLPVDHALGLTRAAICTESDGYSMEWGTPVLYLRAEDGMIFDLPLAVGREPERLQTRTPTKGKKLEGEPEVIIKTPSDADGTDSKPVDETKITRALLASALLAIRNECTRKKVPRLTRGAALRVIEPFFGDDQDTVLGFLTAQHYLKHCEGDRFDITHKGSLLIGGIE